MEVSRGKNGGGQVNRPKPHVSVRGTRKSRKLMRASQHSGAIRHWTRGGRTRMQAEGNARRARVTRGEKSAT